LAQAKELMTMDIGVRAVPAYLVQDWWEYTDFGKGFYTHPDESKTLAVVWAKKKARKENTEWGVVRFTLTQKEFDSIGGAPLHFQNKKSRPGNAPKITPPRPASWLEFVEYNRNIGQEVQRPKDKDWSGQYPWIRGPMWSKEDSGLGASDVGVQLPDHLHQINWGQAGLNALNAKEAKSRRFLFTKDNERELGGQAASAYTGGGGQSGGGGSSDSY